MRLNTLLFAALLLICPVALPAQTKAGSAEAQKQYFTIARQGLEAMLDGQAPLSYEHAVFLTENAYLQGGIDEAAYTSALDAHTERIRNIIALSGAMSDPKPLNALEQAQMSLAERKAAYAKTVANYAIFKYITDTVFYLGKEQAFYHLPYSYSYSDPMGTADWANTQITHLLDTKSGNCFALASLFKIFSDRLGSGARLATAPGHIYIRHADDKGSLYNIELSNGGSFPGTGTIETITHTTREAVRNNIALRDLDGKQSVALCLVYLAKGYEHRTGIKDDDFVLDCAEKALSYDALGLNAMLLKAQVLESRLLAAGRSAAQLQSNPEFITYLEWIRHLYDLGYRDMPQEMKNLLVKGWARDSATVLFTKRHQPGTATKNVLPTRYASLSWGLFDEQINTLPVETFGRTLFDTRSRKITGFAREAKTYNDYDFDPVAFAWQVDPLAYKVSQWSPYSALGDNPILNVDPDGALFFGTFGSSSEQRQSARAFASEHGGTVANTLSKSIHVDYNSGYTWSADREDNGGWTGIKASQYFHGDGSAVNQGGEVSQWIPGLMTKWSESNGLLGRLTYSLADGAYVTAQNLGYNQLTLNSNITTHLGGGATTPDENIDAFVTAAPLLVPGASGKYAMGPLKQWDH